jgi:hypothetical protein
MEVDIVKIEDYMEVDMILCVCVSLCGYIIIVNYNHYIDENTYNFGSHKKRYLIRLNRKYEYANLLKTNHLQKKRTIDYSLECVCVCVCVCKRLIK